MIATYSFDIARILVGDYPPVFYLEVVLRSTLVFAYALFLIRHMGKRNLSQLSAFDLVIIIALGSAVGDPMFYDDVPILPALMATTVVVALNIALAKGTRVHRAFEAVMESSPRLVVMHGVVIAEALHKETLSETELFELLRLAGVKRLQDVEAAILETSGRLSVLEVGSDLSSADLWSEVLRTPRS